MLHFYPQETRYSCVTACLRMVMANLGIIVDEDALRACCGTDRLGTTAQAAVDCATRHGLQASVDSVATLADLNSYVDRLIYPIVYANMFPLDGLWVLHAVVVEAITHDEITFLDPMVGRRHAPTSVFEQAWQMGRRRTIIITIKQ